MSIFDNSLEPVKRIRHKARDAGFLRPKMLRSLAR